MANRNFPNGGKTYQQLVEPVLISINFVVDSTNGNGLGIRSLKGGGVSNVFMNTSATPGTNNGATNPNPAAGYIMVQLADNYARSVSGNLSIVSELTGSALTATAAGIPAVITSLGTATLAQWQAVGLPAGFAPALGQAFIPTTTATIGGSATVKLAGTSGITNIETIGDPNATISPTTPGQGAMFILQCLDATVVTAPANNSVISLQFLLNNSSVQVNGQ